MSNALPLLLTPRETLAVLGHVAKHPKQPPSQAVRALHIGVNTWYAAVRNLESLGLVAATRGPAGRKVKEIHITPEGERVLVKVNELLQQVAHSRAALEWELAHDPPRKGSPRAGEILWRLIEFAQRRADFNEFKRLERVANAFDRPGEALLARQISTFLRAKPSEARRAGEAAVEVLRREGNSPSLRKALSTLAPTYGYLGDSAKATRTNIQARVKAKQAGDFATELEAWLGIGIMQARLGHYTDGIRHMRRALAIAEREGLSTKRALVLGNLAFADGFADEAQGLATADEALRAARKLGARILVARAQLNRGLFLAILGRPDEARAAMAEAKRIFAKGGEEKGAQMLAGWDSMVRRMSRRRPGQSPADWRAQALQLARSRPTPTRASPNAGRSRRTRSG